MCVFLSASVCVHLHCVCVQLVDREKVRATISVNEWYELQFFTNTRKVSYIHLVYTY